MVLQLVPICESKLVEFDVWHNIRLNNQSDPFFSMTKLHEMDCDISNKSPLNAEFHGASGPQGKLLSPTNSQFFQNTEHSHMNLIVKRFFVLALPFLMVGSLADEGYSIQIENESGIELCDVVIAGQEDCITKPNSKFKFGTMNTGQRKGLGHADLQFVNLPPKQLEVSFTPKHGRQLLKNTVELPELGEGRSVKLTINSYLDLITQSRS